MVILTVVGQGSLRLLGNRVASEQRATLLDEAMERLRSDTARIAESLNRSTRQILASCTIQSLQLEQHLAVPPDVAPPAEIFTSTDFGGSAVFPLTPHPEVATANGRAVMVSYDHLVIDAMGDHAETDARLLAAQKPTWLANDLAMRGVATWQFAVLTSGSSAWYPGTQLPDGFDARTLPFVENFLQQAEQNNVISTGVSAYQDPLSGMVLVGLSRPFSTSDGTVVGTTGVLIAVDSLQKSYTPNLAWQEDSRFYLVTRKGLNERGEPFIIAQQDYVSADAEKGGAVPVQFFSLDTPNETKKLVEAVNSPEIGTHRVSKDKRAMIASTAAIGFGRDSDIGIITMIPEDVVTRHADRASAHILRAMYNRLIGNLGIIAGVLAVVLVSALLGVRRLTRPINHLMDAARKIASGDLDAKAEVHTGDELQELAETFNTMTPRLRDHMRVRSALDLAMEVQQHLLPAVAPRVPGLELAGKSIPCDEVGGDYYDFLEMGEVDDGRVGIAIGDVTGHGIAAALLMTSARAMLRSRACESDVNDTMALRVTDINRQLAADVSHGRFMTLCWMLMDGKNRTLQWVCAGHDPALLMTPDGHTEHLRGSGLPLGIEPHVTYAQFRRTDVPSGSVIILGTDGIWETRNASGDMFGKERMEKIIRDHRTQSAPEILDSLVHAVQAFRGEADSLDDITLVVARFA